MKRHKVSGYVRKVINVDINNPKLVKEIASIHGMIWGWSPGACILPSEGCTINIKERTSR